MELADCHVLVAGEAAFEEGDYRFVVHPGRDVARVRYGRSEGSTRSGASATSRCVPSSPELDTSARTTPARRRMRSPPSVAGSPTHRGCNDVRVENRKLGGGDRGSCRKRQQKHE
jgi:hypothetical protein